MSSTMELSRTKGVFVVAALAALTLALLALSPGQGGGAVSGGGVIPHLTATLGVSSGTAVTIWNAYNSWWATALSIALIPLGFGAWAVTIRLTFNRLVATLGKRAARQAAIRF